MKQLMLMRHAKSVREPGGPPDVDRPLNERGLRAAPEMGKRLVERGEVPEHIVSSHARRALHTAQLVADACGIARADIEIVDELYDSTPSVWIKCIHALSTKFDRVLMVGHNPEMSELAQRLSGEGIDELPTAAILRLDYGGPDWSVVGNAKPRDWNLDTPKKKG